MSDVTSAHIVIDRAASRGPIRRIWSSIGYDELNWTYTSRGRAIHRLLGEDVLTSGPYYVRMHNAFTSGNGASAPAWGAGNPYHELADGTPRYAWDVLDRAYDTITSPGGRPLIELGFMPRDLSRAVSSATGFGPGYDLGREPYELGDWKQPPKDLGRWSDLVHAFVSHLVDRYGADAVAAWRFELWNEPDIPNYWHGTLDEYCSLYDATAAAARAALPNVQVGGPATTHHGAEFLDGFLSHLATNSQRPDFISFHVKGAAYQPRRRYNPFVEPPRESPSTASMVSSIERSLATIARFPQFAGIPVCIDECDPAVGTIYGVYDNPSFVVTNSEHYASFVVQLVARLIEFPAIELITHWAFYMEAKRWFEGNRTLVDNDNVEKPILNGLRLLERLAGGKQLAVQSNRDDVGGIAVQHDNGLRVLVWHHRDAWWETDAVDVSVDVAGVQPGTGSVRVWRLDRAHANTFRAWEALGSPEEPSPQQVAQLRDAGLLQSQEMRMGPIDGGVRMGLKLPLHGLALLETEAA